MCGKVCYLSDSLFFVWNHFFSLSERIYSLCSQWSKILWWCVLLWVYFIFIHCARPTELENFILPILQCFPLIISVMIPSLLFYVFSFFWVPFFFQMLYLLEWFIYFPLLFSISFLYISFWMISSDYLKTLSFNIFVYALIYNFFSCVFCSHFLYTVLVPLSKFFFHLLENINDSFLKFLCPSLGRISCLLIYFGLCISY